MLFVHSTFFPPSASFFRRTDAAMRTTQVTSVLPSGAAAQAGLEPGQIIQSIGDTSLAGLTVHQVQSLIDETATRFVAVFPVIVFAAAVFRFGGVVLVSGLSFRLGRVLRHPLSLRFIIILSTIIVRVSSGRSGFRWESINQTTMIVTN